MAKGATETGKVEAYMCNKISRNPLVANCCAQFLGSFTSPATDGGDRWRVGQRRKIGVLQSISRPLCLKQGL